MKVKCVAMLPNFFLRTNEVSLQIDGCQHQFPPSQISSDIDQVNQEHFHNLYGKNSKNKIPFEFVKSSTGRFMFNISVIFFSLILFCYNRDLLNKKY